MTRMKKLSFRRGKRNSPARGCTSSCQPHGEGRREVSEQSAVPKNQPPKYHLVILSPHLHPPHYRYCPCAFKEYALCKSLHALILPSVTLIPMGKITPQSTESLTVTFSSILDGEQVVVLISPPCWWHALPLCPFASPDFAVAGPEATAAQLLPPVPAGSSPTFCPCASHFLQQRSAKPFPNTELGHSNALWAGGNYQSCLLTHQRSSSRVSQD